MVKLEKTVYSNDLNEINIRHDTLFIVGNKFPLLTRYHSRNFCGTTHKNNNSFSPDEFLIKLKNHLHCKLSDAPFFRESLLAMNQYNLKNTVVLH